MFSAPHCYVRRLWRQPAGRGGSVEHPPMVQACSLGLSFRPRPVSRGYITVPCIPSALRFGNWPWEAILGQILFLGTKCPFAELCSHLREAGEWQPLACLPQHCLPASRTRLSRHGFLRLPQLTLKHPLAQNVRPRWASAMRLPVLDPGARCT